MPACSKTRTAGKHRRVPWENEQCLFLNGDPRFFVSHQDPLFTYPRADAWLVRLARANWDGTTRLHVGINTRVTIHILYFPLLGNNLHHYLARGKAGLLHYPYTRHANNARTPMECRSGSQAGRAISSCQSCLRLERAMVFAGRHLFAWMEAGNADSTASRYGRLGGFGHSRCDGGGSGLEAEEVE